MNQNLNNILILVHLLIILHDALHEVWLGLLMNTHKHMQSVPHEVKIWFLIANKTDLTKLDFVHFVHTIVHLLMS